MEKKVKLYTNSAEMESIMLSEYPGRIFEHQYKVDKSGPGLKVYIFSDLNQNELMKFAIKYFGEHMFEIRGKDGKVLVTSRKEKIAKV